MKRQWYTHAVECYTREPLCDGTKMSGFSKFPLESSAVQFGRDMVNPMFGVVLVRPINADGSLGEGYRVRGMSEPITKPAPVITYSQKRTGFMGTRYSAWIQFADGTHEHDADTDRKALELRVEAKYGVKGIW